MLQVRPEVDMNRPGFLDFSFLDRMHERSDGSGGGAVMKQRRDISRSTYERIIYPLFHRAGFIV